MSKLDTFAEIFQLPPAMIPHIDFVVTEQEMDLVVGLDGQEMTVEEIAKMMNMSLEEADEFVTKAFHRDVIAKAGAGRGYVDEEKDAGPPKYKTGTFYRRLDPMSMYEDWGDVPIEARNAVIEWQLQEYINLWQPALDEIQKNPDARVRIPNRDYLLLDEALEMVDAANDHVVVPCDCKEIVRACDVPTEHCVRLDQGAILTLEHGHGRRVTKEEMKQIVIDANLNGLMATGDREWKQNGQLFGFCNCCACDCYPIRASKKVGLGNAYPRVYYIAERDMDKCLHCGQCATRCHFDAFYHDGSRIEVVGKRGSTLNPRQVLFNPEECRGCGICATTCSEGAITMSLRAAQEMEAA
jgi:Pyruvate/2-oxoacid:ferredoxin oxidoreductase delta subunit